MEIGDAEKWGEGGKNINRTGEFSILQIQCRKLGRPTEKFKKSNCLLNTAQTAMRA